MKLNKKIFSLLLAFFMIFSCFADIIPVAAESLPKEKTGDLKGVKKGNKLEFAFEIPQNESAKGSAYTADDGLDISGYGFEAQGAGENDTTIELITKGLNNGEFDWSALPNSEFKLIAKWNTTDGQSHEKTIGPITKEGVREFKVDWPVDGTLKGKAVLQAEYDRDINIRVQFIPATGEGYSGRFKFKVTLTELAESRADVKYVDPYGRPLKDQADLPSDTDVMPKVTADGLTDVAIDLPKTLGQINMRSSDDIDDDELNAAANGLTYKVGGQADEGTVTIGGKDYKLDISQPNAKEIATILLAYQKDVVVPPTKPNSDEPVEVADGYVRLKFDANEKVATGQKGVEGTFTNEGPYQGKQLSYIDVKKGVQYDNANLKAEIAKLSTTGTKGGITYTQDTANPWEPGVPTDTTPATAVTAATYNAKYVKSDKDVIPYVPADPTNPTNPDDKNVPTTDDENKPVDKTQYDIVAFKTEDIAKGKLELGELKDKEVISVLVKKGSKWNKVTVPTPKPVDAKVKFLSWDPTLPESTVDVENGKVYTAKFVKDGEEITPGTKLPDGVFEVKVERDDTSIKGDPLYGKSYAVFKDSKLAKEKFPTPVKKDDTYTDPKWYSRAGQANDDTEVANNKPEDVVITANTTFTAKASKKSGQDVIPYEPANPNDPTNSSDTNVPNKDNNNQTIDPNDYIIIAFKVADTDATKGSLTLGNIADKQVISALVKKGSTWEKVTPATINVTDATTTKANGYKPAIPADKEAVVDKSVYTAQFITNGQEITPGTNLPDGVYEVKVLRDEASVKEDTNKLYGKSYAVFKGSKLADDKFPTPEAADNYMNPKWYSGANQASASTEVANNKPEDVAITANTTFLAKAAKKSDKDVIPYIPADPTNPTNPDDTKVPTVDEDNKPIDKTQYNIVAFKVTDADKTKGSLTLGKLDKQQVISVLVKKGSKWEKVTAPTINVTDATTTKANGYKPAIPATTATVENGKVYEAQFITNGQEIDPGTNLPDGVFEVKVLRDETSIERNALYGKSYAVFKNSNLAKDKFPDLKAADKFKKPAWHQAKTATDPAKQELGEEVAAPATVTITENTTFTAKAVSAVFDKDNVTDMKVKTQPELNYVEGDATKGKLDLSNLVVELTDKNGNTQDVPFDKLGEYGITPNPANGADMTVDGNNGKPVVLTKGTLTANTDNLKVTKGNTTDPVIPFEPKDPEKPGDKDDENIPTVNPEDKKPIKRDEYVVVGFKVDPKNSGTLTLGKVTNKPSISALVKKDTAWEGFIMPTTKDGNDYVFWHWDEQPAGNVTDGQVRVATFIKSGDEIDPNDNNPLPTDFHKVTVAKGIGIANDKLFGKTYAVKKGDKLAKDKFPDLVLENAAIYKNPVWNVEKPWTVAVQDEDITFTASATNAVFDVNKVKDMEVVRDPKLNYVEGDATEGKLDLSKLVVRLTDEDGNTQDVYFNQLGDYGITTAPANGTDMTVDGNNNKPVKVTKARTGKESLTAETSKLNVKKLSDKEIIPFIPDPTDPNNGKPDKDPDGNTINSDDYTTVYFQVDPEDAAELLLSYTKNDKSKVQTKGKKIGALIKKNITRDQSGTVVKTNKKWSEITIPTILQLVKQRKEFFFKKWIDSQNAEMVDQTLVDDGVYIAKFYKNDEIVGPKDPSKPDGKNPKEEFYWTVTFVSADESTGKVANENTYYVLKTANKTLDDLIGPTTIPAPGYVFDKWTPALDKNTAIDQDLRIVGSFKLAPIVPEKSHEPKIDPIYDSDEVVTGEGEPGAKIIVEFPDGEKVEVPVDPYGRWIVPVPYPLYEDDVVRAKQIENGKTESDWVSQRVRYDEDFWRDRRDRRDREEKEVKKPVEPKKVWTPDALNARDHFSYIKGYGNNMFAPNRTITRAEVAMIFARLSINQSTVGAPQFKDVKAGDWYKTAVDIMARQGVIKGYEDGTFRPNQPITRREFAAIAARYAGNIDAWKTFRDVPPTDWAYTLINRVAGAGWINGYEDGTFRPNNNITRAEVVAIVNRMLNRKADKKYVDNNLMRAKYAFVDNMRSAWYFYDIYEAAIGHSFERQPNGVDEKWNRVNGQAFEIRER